MKPNKPVWLAISLATLAGGCWLIVRQASPQAPSFRESRAATAPDRGGREHEPAPISVSKNSAYPKTDAPDQATDRFATREVVTGGSAPGPMASISSDSSPLSIKRGQDRNGGPMGSLAAGKDPVDLPTPAATPPAGLRLAPDVRLPAAALPVDFKMTAVAEKALKNIIDDYYLDLAEALAPELEAAANSQDNAGAGNLIETGENGEKTIVVTNGKIAEDARKRADARFRALFGNAHFNRMTIQSALESRLPADGKN